MDGKQILKLLEVHGWQVIRTRGSHYHLFQAVLSKNVTIPIHGKKDLSIGTIKSIERSTGVKLTKGASCKN